MRKIKFRAWHKEQKKIYSAEELGRDQLTLMPDGRGFVNVSGDSFEKSQIDNNNKMIPLQYIGLKDKNGKEIYEGDLIKIRCSCGYTAIGVVKYEHSSYIISCRDHHDWDNCQDRFSWIDKKEVIGNIHENPELLKEK